MSILDLIDHSLRDDTVSPDAARWTPDDGAPLVYTADPARILQAPTVERITFTVDRREAEEEDGGRFTAPTAGWYQFGPGSPGLARQLWFDKQGQPIDSETANTLLGDRAYRRVALTRIRSKGNPAVDLRVSTVWLGVDYNFLGGPPILFETMVFGPGSGEQQWRWCTEGQALAGHAHVVAELAAGVPRVRVAELDSWGGPSFLDARYRQRQINRRRRRK